MASYQDIETRVAALERRIHFVMEVMRIAQQSPILGGPPKVVSLNDLYLESQRAGLAPVPVSEANNA